MNAGIIFLELNILCISSVVMMISKIMKGGERKNRCNRAYLKLLFTNLFLIITNMITGILNEPSLMLVNKLKYLVFSRTISDVALYLTVYTWISYLITMEKPFSMGDKGIKLLWALPFVGLTFLSMYSPFTRIFFYVNKEGVLCSGDLAVFQVLVVYITALLASVISLTYSGKYDDREKQKNIVRIASYPVLPFIASMLQIYTDQYYLSTAVTIMLMIIYLNRQENRISKDPLTKLNNRFNLYRYMEEKIENSKSDVYAIMMDINNFKEINDNYGHVEGDRILVYVANSIKSVTDQLGKNGFLARYGGDEFILIANLKSEIEVRNLVQEMKQKVGYNAPGLKKTPISIACGYVKYSRKYKDIDSFIDAADEAMYSDKYKSRKIIDPLYEYELLEKCN